HRFPVLRKLHTGYFFITANTFGTIKKGAQDFSLFFIRRTKDPRPNFGIIYSFRQLLRCSIYPHPCRQPAKRRLKKQSKHLIIPHLTVT
ncbi:MAG: hypothetical protein KAT04_06785, partial [Methylococcales bacterium]|nr:hypothetical protein [Methylococcales bacterium]